MRKIVLIVLLLCVLPVKAEGFSEAKIVVELTKMLKALNDQLAELKDQVDITKHLDEMEQLKGVREVVDGSQDFKGLFNEVGRTVDLSEGIIVTPMESFDEVSGEVDKLVYRLERNGENPDQLAKLKRYSQIIGSIERLQLLGNANRSTMKRVAEGVNDSEAMRISAQANTTAVELLAAQLTQQQQEKAARQKAFMEQEQANQTLLNGYQYIK